MVDILAATRDSRSWSKGVRYAAQLAARCRGTLTAVYVIPPPMVIPETTALSLVAELLEMEREESAAALHAQEPFSRWAQEQGVQSATWHVAEGNESAVLQASAKWCDVLIVDGVGADYDVASLGAMGEVLLHTDAPCMIVPPESSAATFGTAAIAWKGTAESARALQAALPLLECYERIVVIHGERGIASQEREASAQGAVQHLLGHGLHSSLKRIDADPRSAGEAIFAAAAEEAAGLVVMGAYGRTRFSEWIFGGATRYALESARMPVLMRH